MVGEVYLTVERVGHRGVEGMICGNHCRDAAQCSLTATQACIVFLEHKNPTPSYLLSGDQAGHTRTLVKKILAFFNVR